MARSVEEVREAWLHGRYMNPFVVSYVEARVNNPSGIAVVDANWRGLYEFYLEHGFIPDRFALSVARMLASLN